LAREGDDTSHVLPTLPYTNILFQLLEIHKCTREMDVPRWQASSTAPISAADTDIVYGDHLMWLYKWMSYPTLQL